MAVSVTGFHSAGVTWSPDGEHLGYLATNATIDQASVITVAPGTSNQRITVSSDSSNILSYPTFRWVSGNRLLYSFGDSIEIASAGESASNQTLSANLNVNVNVGASAAAYVQMTANPHNTVPEEQRIGFLAHREGSDVISLFTNLTDGTDLQDAGGSFVAGGGVSSFQFAENVAP